MIKLMKKMLKYTPVLFCLFYFQGWTQNEVIDDKKEVLIKVIGGGKVSYEKANKIAEEPSFVDTVKVKLPVKYDVVDKKVSTSFKVETIKPPKLLLLEPLKKIYKQEVSLGLNDFKSPPYFNYVLSTIRNKEYNAGIKLNHFSSEMNLKNHDAGRFTESEIVVYGKKINKKTTLYADMDYDYNTFRFYGFDPSINIINPKDNQQYYSLLNGSFGIKSNKNSDSKLKYQTGINYQQMFSKYSVEEHLITLSGDISGKYLPKWKMFDSLDLSNVFGQWNLKFDAAHLISKDSTLDINSTLFTIRPSYELKRGAMNLELALPIYFLTNNKRFLTALPTLNVNYAIAKDILIVYGGWDRQYQRNHYLTYLDQNPFIESNLNHTNTYTNINIVGGLKGAFSSKTTFNLGYRYKYVEDFVLFVNSITSVANRKFDIETDDVVHQQIFGELMYENKKLKTGLTAQYNNYKMYALKAYHLPAIYAQVYAKYNVQNKFYLGADVFYFGEQIAKNNAVTFAASEPITLRPILDFNLSVDYHYSEKLGAFLKVNNILSTKHQRWNQYPNYGINLLGGVRYSF